MKPDQNLYLFSMGKRLRVTAIFHTVDATNEYLSKHKDEGVIANFDPYVFVASIYDKGTL